MNNKGQSVLSEYVMIFFVVIAAVVAMTTFVQRCFEARVHDAKNYMIDSVVNSGACDADCLKATGATGGTLPHEYEPYYTQAIADVNHSDNTYDGATTGNPQALGAVYYKTLNEQNQSNSTSYQLPPQCINGGC